MDKFWMVLVEGTEGTHKTYATINLAEVEAERLAVQTGKRVYVLESIEACAPQPRPVVWERRGE